MSNNTALMAGNWSVSKFYGVRLPSIPTQSLCVDKPVSKSIGLRTSGLSEQEGAVLPSPLISGGLFENKLGFFLLPNRIIYVWKRCNQLFFVTTFNKNRSLVKNSHWELVSKVCFRKLDHEWDAESVEPSELIWAKWGRKLAPRCETKRLRRAIKKTSTSQKGALRTLCYTPLQNQPRRPAGKRPHSLLMLNSKFNHGSFYTVYLKI